MSSVLYQWKWLAAIWPSFKYKSLYSYYKAKCSSWIRTMQLSQSYFSCLEVIKLYVQIIYILHVGNLFLPYVESIFIFSNIKESQFLHFYNIYMLYVHDRTAIYFEWKGSWLDSTIIYLMSIISMPLSFFFQMYVFRNV